MSVDPPVSDATDVDDALEFASRYGLTADEWQESVIEGWLGRRRGGKWSASRCGLSVPRQNGKNGALEIRELFGMVYLGEKFLHTAHEVKTARKAFRRLLGFFENPRKYPELAELVVEIRKTNGQEAIVLSNGGAVEFVARSKGSGRGFTVDVLVCDEAQDLSDDDLAALLPTISAAPLGNPQTILTGTPPTPVMHGEVFGRWRAEALDAKPGANRLSWKEWSVPRPDTAALDLDERELWAQANPGLGIRLLDDTIEDERASMDDETFMRERLGMWDARDAEPVDELVPAVLWRVLTDSSVGMESVRAFGVEVAVDRLSGWICAAGPVGERIAVELMPWQHGTDDLPPRGIGWMVERGVELSAKHPAPFVIDAGGPAGSLIAPLQQAGLQVVIVGVQEITAAAAAFVDAVTDGSIVHGPQPDLDVSGVKKRSLGDGRFAVSRRNSPPNAPAIIAATLAHLHAREHRAPEVWSIREMVEQLKREQAEAAEADREPTGA